MNFLLCLLFQENSYKGYDECNTYIFYFSLRGSFLKFGGSSQAGPQFRIVPVEFVFLPLWKAFLLGKYLFVVRIVLSTHSDVLNIFPWALRF